MPSVRRPLGASLAKDGKKFSSVQPDLFGGLAEGAELDHDLNVEVEFLGALNTALREARRRGMSRERVIDAMNERLPGMRRPVTLRMLNSWTAISKEYHEFPARLLAAFCAVTECDLPMRVLALPIGRELVDSHELDLKRLGENLTADARLKRERRLLQQRLVGG